MGPGRGVPQLDQDSVNHGTAVMGVLCGGRNRFGVTGICPDATIGAVSLLPSSCAAIVEAADFLQPGDVLLLEVHYPGPRSGFQERDDQLGYVPIEWWPDDLAAIQYAVRRGIVGDLGRR